MYKRWITTLSSVALCCLLTGFLAYGASNEVETKGIIISRAGDTLTVKNPEGNFTVILTDDTRTKDNKGLFGLHKEYMANTVLIPGLKVMKIKGVTDEQGRIIAKTITVDGDDLETAEMIQAGLHPTAEQVAANERAMAANQQATAANTQQIQQNMQDIQQATDRFSKLDDYDVKDKATVNFDVGSSALSPQAKQQLQQLAQAAVNTPGYMLEVKGFADSSGDAVMNEKLSEDRADAVVGYLIQQCHVPVRNIVAPGAMGEYQPAAINETPQGRAQNRRVEVAVLVNKGITGQ